MDMEREQILTIVREELPRLLRDDDEVRGAVSRVYAEAHGPEGESRFDRMMNELKADREEQACKWDEQDPKWDRVHEEIMAIDRRLQSSITAIGARWGLHSESAFRNGLVLEDRTSADPPPGRAPARRPPPRVTAGLGADGRRNAGPGFPVRLPSAP